MNKINLTEFLAAMAAHWQPWPVGEVNGHDLMAAQLKITSHHRQLAKIYPLLILATPPITLLMPAEVGPRFLGHFGSIDSLTLLTLVTVPVALRAARSHNIKRDRDGMVGSKVGGLLIASSIAFTPGRFQHGWPFGA